MVGYKVKKIIKLYDFNRGRIFIKLFLDSAKNKMIDKSFFLHYDGFVKSHDEEK